MYSSLQYYSYDFNSFIADVGGYLGLLLGHSIYSFYNVVEMWVRRRKDTLCGGKKSIDQDSKQKEDSDTNIETF